MKDTKNKKKSVKKKEEPISDHALIQQNEKLYQKHYDEFQERWGEHYSNGDDCCDDAFVFAVAKIKDPSLDVEDYGVDA